MNWLVFHIVSGQAFFSGSVCVLAAGFFSLANPNWLKRAGVLVFVLGLILIAVSSTAIPYWYYAIVGLASLFWLGCHVAKSMRVTASIVLIVGWMVAMAWELPFHVQPVVSESPTRSLSIIGDSVTAGVGDGDQHTWPKLLAQQHNLTVQDISHVGETAASALERVRAKGIQSSLVIIEIGGNDLLGSTSSKQFESDLEDLLAHVAQTDRQVLMFELPLPPFCHEYGRIQRQLAAKHGVLLIPKRVFLSVLGGSGSTLDSIHLSQAGHEQMAVVVWNLIESAFE